MIEKNFVKKRFLAILFAAFLILASNSYAVNIGISPGVAVLSKMLRGGYASRTVTVSTSMPDNLTASLEVYGNVKDWMTVGANATNITFSGGTPYKMKLIVTPPLDVQNGNYTGFIRIITDKLGKLTGGTGSVVKAAVVLQLRVEIIGQEILACRAGAFSIPSIEVGYPLEVWYIVANDGNVKLKPHIQLDIWDQLQENLLHSTEFFDETVKQTEEERIGKLVYLNLPIGQYWAKINVVECGISDLLTFSVLEKGAIEDTGELVDVKTTPWAKVGDIVPIVATFRNKGSRLVFAKFKGKISLNDQIVQLIDTPEMQVQPQESVNFTSYYSPKIAGKYLVTGRVNYNKKLTYEKGTVINVIAQPAKPMSAVARGLRLLPLAIFALIIASIIVLLSKIRRAKRRIRRKF